MTITVYSKNNCVFVAKLSKSLLKILNFEYEEKSLEKDFDYDS